MLANYHTHSTFCDGKNTPEEIVEAAIEQGFAAIGFSGHGNTPFDLRYCMKDTKGYIEEIKRLKEKYAGKIQIYLGVEEDAFCPVERSKFDYIIGSSHYFQVNGKYYPIDSGFTYFQECLALFQGDTLRMARAYYDTFCEYIVKRKPDIVGHFDLITKFDELDGGRLLNDPEYNALAEYYLSLAISSGCLFEVNTGAISRGVRTTPYPAVNLLKLLKEKGAKLVLSSDSHSAQTLRFGFEEAGQVLKEIGFTHTYILYDGKFFKQAL